MKNGLIIISLILLLSYSCNNGYHKNNNRFLKENKDSIINLDSLGKIKMIEKFHTKDSVFLWNYKNNQLISKGVMYKKEAFGKWNFYNKNHLAIVREFIRIDNQSYMNQVWFFDNNKDTIKGKGNYYRISFNDTILVNSTVIIRLFLEQPLDNKADKMFVDYKGFFSNKRTNKIQEIGDVVLGVNNEVLLELTFNDLGKFNFKGFFEQSYYIEGSNNQVVRKLYFDKELLVIGAQLPHE